MKRFLSSRAALLTGLAAVTFASAASADGLILNGGFESNGGADSSSFTSWTVSVGPGSGIWYAQTGTTSPANGFTTPSPPEGSFAAMTDATGPGSHILYQDFVVPSNIHGATLSFNGYLNNGGDFLSPATLSTGVPNQQARVDIMTTAADPFSVADGDVLLNVFQTHPGDPLTSGYTVHNTDVGSLLSARAGQTLRLRFAEADQNGPLQFGVDSVSLSTNTPEPGAYALFIASGVSGAGLLLRRRRARK